MKEASNNGRSSGGSTAPSNAAVAEASARPILLVSITRSRGHRAPDVEEVEPLSRVLAHDVLQDGDPGARRVFLAAARDGEGLCQLDRVPVVRVEEAEGRNQRHPDRARQEERTKRERRGPPEE